jgi:hypothetical protein
MDNLTSLIGQKCVFLWRVDKIVGSVIGLVQGVDDDVIKFEPIDGASFPYWHFEAREIGQGISVDGASTYVLLSLKGADYPETLKERRVMMVNDWSAHVKIR